MKKILIDTSIWVDYFKGSEVVTGAINDLETGTIYITGPVMTELIMGVKNKKESKDLVLALESLLCLEITGQEWIDAGMLGSALRQKGITIPLPDLIIFTVARNNNCAIWSRDKHFKIIRETTGSDLAIIEPGLGGTDNRY